LARLAREVAVLRARSRLQRALLAVFAVGTLVALYLVTQPYVLRYRAANAVPLVPVPELGVAFEAYEVTNERYGWCIAAGICDTPNGFRAVEADWAAYRLKPVVGVDAAEAMAFCKWIGRTLPTQAEWEAVAPPFAQWRHLGADEALLCRLASELCTELEAAAVLTPVGAGRRSQYAADAGIYDLVGSVTEWTSTQRSDGDAGVTLDDIKAIPLETINLITPGQNYRTPVVEAGLYGTLNTITTSDMKSDEVGIRCVE
jgi:formylglycine-generating enzyme required for sulfatase activity